MKKLRIYLDTSVINFLFAEDAPEKMEVTKDFFNNYLNDYDVFISEHNLVEIYRTKNEIKKTQLLNAIEEYKLIAYAPINDDITTLAEEYIINGILSDKKLDDAIHIAYATYYEFDILLSWNFKDIANIKKQLEIEIINKQNGYLKNLLLINPYEVVYGK